MKRGSSNAKFQELDSKALGLTLGWIVAVSMFLLSLMPFLIQDWGKTLILEIQSVYIGYTWGFKGGVIGAIYGFIDGFIGGYLIGYLYNHFKR